MQWKEYAIHKDDHTASRNEQIQDEDRNALKTRLTEGDTFGIINVG
jgi:hypothetical protein